MSFANPFHGALALFRADRHVHWRAALWGGLLPGVVIGGSVRERVETASIDLTQLALAVSALGAAIVPLLASPTAPFHSTPTGTRSRRDELLALPLGRFAIPASTMLVGVVATAAAVGTLLGVLALLCGVAPLVAGLSTIGWPTLLLFPFALSFGLGEAAVGNNRAGFVSAIIAPALVVFACLPCSGLPMDVLVALAVLGGASISAGFLVVPFVLHAGPAHRLAGRGERDWPEVAALVCGGLALPIFCLAGAGPLLGIIVAAGCAATFVLRRLEPRVERRPVPALRAATAVMLLAAAVPAGAIAVVDGARATTRVPQRSSDQDLNVLPSPDGKRALALLVEEGPSWSTPDLPLSMQGVALIDLEGKLPPRRLVERFGGLAPHAWSADGRHAAVLDFGPGRISLAYLDVASWRGPSLFEGAARAALEPWIETVVLDAETGETTRIPRALTGPGWTRPEELVRVRQRIDGSILLEDGRGRHGVLPAVSDFLDRWQTTVRYGPAGAEFDAHGRRWRLEDRGLVEIGDAVCWRAAQPRSERRAGMPATAMADTVAVFTRGGARREVPGAWQLLLPDPRCCVVAGMDGVVRFDLETGERRVLLEPERLHRPVAYPAPADARPGRAPRLVVTLADGSAAVLDPSSGAVEPVGAIEPPLVGKRIAGETILGWAGTDLYVAPRAGGRARRVLTSAP